MLFRKTRLFALFAMVCCASSPSLGQEREVPYWASLSAEEVNMRVGPSERFRIEWVYRKRGLPVKVVRLQQGWRLIEEPDGTQGWVFNQLLSLERHAIVIGDEDAALRELPQSDSMLLWNVEAGVIGTLGTCEQGWCEFAVDSQAGWIERDRLWGAGEP